jgi:adenylosuccinate synthase
VPVIAIIGGQWGDEGKGKIVDLVAREARMVVRFSGGNNAGHTVVNPYGEFRLHLVPSGIFNPQAACVVGNGVVIDPAVFLEEIEQLQKRGVNTDRLFISDRAHLIMPYHILLDALEEESRGGRALGTTRKGVGPAYVDKTARLGIRAGDILDSGLFRERLDSVLNHKNAILTKVYGAASLSLEEIHSQYCQYGQRLAPFIRETNTLVGEALARGDLILLEGAQGTMLDLDFGTYPYVTSSSPIAGGACSGLGLSPTKIDHILGVFKSYTTRVGSGPIPTELKDETGRLIRERAQEYGTTTGRPRRCGWFDAVVARFSAEINGFTGIALTRLDVLDVLPQIKICTGYKLDGDIIDYLPSSAATLERCQPVYQEMSGWQTPVSQVRRFEDLPPEASHYVTRLQELVGCPINLISVGPSREQTIEVEPIL